MTMVVILLLSFLAVASLVVGMGFAMEKDPAQERLRRLGKLGANIGEAPSILFGGSGSPVTRFLERLGRGRAEKSDRTAMGKTRRRLVHAGYRRPSALAVYFGARILCAGLFPLLLVNTPFYGDLDPVRALGLLALAAGMGLVVPSFFVDRQADRRQLSIEQALPDALDLMVVCVESGLGMTAGLARVAHEFAASRPILSEEFELVTLEIAAGKSNVEALRSLADRTGVSEVSALVAMLIQTERFGTSVADALRVHADAMRTRRIQRAEEAAAKAPVKMLFPAGVFIFPATLIFIVGPGLLQLIRTLGGS